MGKTLNWKYFISPEMKPQVNNLLTLNNLLALLTLMWE